MPRVKLTRHLQRFFHSLENNLEVEGRTVAEVVAALDRRHPGFASYIVDEHGALRRHVNIFVGDSQVRDREGLEDPVSADAQLFIFQALSGGCRS